MHNRDTTSLGQRLGRFFMLLGAIFGITAAVVVTQRLSDDALALVIGLLLAGIPLLALVGILMFLLIRQAQRRPVQPQQQQVIPPIILQMPQQPQQPPPLPDYGTQWDIPQRTGEQRQWDVIGDE